MRSFNFKTVLNNVYKFKKLTVNKTQCHALLHTTYISVYYATQWILSQGKLLQTAMHWQNQLFLTLESLTFHLFMLFTYKKQKMMSLECAHNII